MILGTHPSPASPNDVCTFGPSSWRRGRATPGRAICAVGPHDPTADAALKRQPCTSEGRFPERVRSVLRDGRSAAFIVASPGWVQACVARARAACARCCPLEGGCVRSCGLARAKGTARACGRGHSMEYMQLPAMSMLGGKGGVAGKAGLDGPGGLRPRGDAGSMGVARLSALVTGRDQRGQTPAQALCVLKRSSVRHRVPEHPWRATPFGRRSRTCGRCRSGRSRGCGGRGTCAGRLT